METKDDYIGSDDLLYCGKCRTPKQFQLDDKVKMHFKHLDKVSTLCKCEFEARNNEQDLKKARELKVKSDDLRRAGIDGTQYFNWTFDMDDRSNKRVSDGCRKYVDDWEDMLKDNVGLLFMGGVGVGKTFYACCIANAIIDKQTPALVTNFPRLLRLLQATAFDKDGMDILNRLQKYDLVVIDDLGAERSTEYALEQMYLAVDTRYRSGKPTIITTNLPPQALMKPENLAYKRIYDRILEMCAIVVVMEGNSRRQERKQAQRDKYKGLFA